MSHTVFLVGESEEPAPAPTPGAGMDDAFWSTPATADTGEGVLPATADTGDADGAFWSTPATADTGDLNGAFWSSPATGGTGDADGVELHEDSWLTGFGKAGVSVESGPKTETILEAGADAELTAGERVATGVGTLEFWSTPATVAELGVDSRVDSNRVSDAISSS